MCIRDSYGLLDDYQISGMSKSKSGLSGIQVYQEYGCTIRYHMCKRSTVCTVMYIKFVSKTSGHHSRYRDNHESQVYHAGCQVIA